MQGSGEASSALKTAFFTAAMPVRGAISGASVALSIAALPGAAVGWLAGKAVSQAVKLTCNILNYAGKAHFHINTEKHAKRTVKVLQTVGAGALLVPGFAVMNAATPLAGTILTALPAVGAGANLYTAAENIPTVYEEYRETGSSPTLKKRLCAPIPNILSSIWKGDTLGFLKEALGQTPKQESVKSKKVEPLLPTVTPNYGTFKPQLTVPPKSVMTTA